MQAGVGYIVSVAGRADGAHITDMLDHGSESQRDNGYAGRDQQAHISLMTQQKEYGIFFQNRKSDPGSVFNRREIYFTDDSEEDGASEDGTVEIPSETVNNTLYVASVASVVNDEIEPALPEIVEEPAEVIPEETTPEPEAVEPAEEEIVSEATEDVAEEITPDVAEEAVTEEPITTDEVVAE